MLLLQLNTPETDKCFCWGLDFLLEDKIKTELHDAWFASVRPVRVCGACSARGRPPDHMAAPTAWVPPAQACTHL
jgi:hypothetical protein